MPGSSKAQSVQARMDELEAEFGKRFPALTAPDARRPSPDFTRITLGSNERDDPVRLDERPRLEHMHIVGVTGSGKTTLLEHMVRQDIARGRGVTVFDPHGNHPDSLYRRLASWLDRSGFIDTGRVHLIDPNVREHVVGLNPLAPLDDTDHSVIADALLEAFSRVWGDEDMLTKPTIRTVLRATFVALIEMRLTLAEAKLLYDPHDTHGVRARVISQLTDEYARDELERLHQTALDERSKRDFRGEVVGPINRINEFVSSNTIRAMFGQTERVLDLQKILDKGEILLVNLGHGRAVSEANTRLLGTLLLRYLFLLCARRKNLEPCFLYIDECHRYLTGDIPNILPEVRKYGIGVVLAHQFLHQLGKPDDAIYQAAMNSTEIKAVFRINSPDEAQALAETVLPLDLEMPVAASVRPTAVGQRRVQLPSQSRSLHQSESEGEAHSVGEMEAHSSGRASGVVTAAGSASGSSELASQLMTPSPSLFGPNAPNATGLPMVLSQTAGTGLSQVSSTSEARSDMSSESETYARSHATTTTKAKAEGSSTTEGWTEGFETIYQDLPTSFHSLENARYMAGEVLRKLPVGSTFVAWRGQHARVKVPPPR